MSHASLPKQHRTEHAAWRGIRRCRAGCCPEWRASFAVFLAGVGPRPTPDHHLARSDKGQPWAPANCRWRAGPASAWGRATDHWIEWAGERLPMAEWSRRTGIPQSVLRYRIDLAGWSLDRALTTPRHGWRRRRSAS